MLLLCLNIITCNSDDEIVYVRSLVHELELTRVGGET